MVNWRSKHIIITFKAKKATWYSVREVLVIVLFDSLAANVKLPPRKSAVGFKFVVVVCVDLIPEGHSVFSTDDNAKEMSDFLNSGTSAEF